MLIFQNYDLHSFLLAHLVETDKISDHFKTLAQSQKRDLEIETHLFFEALKPAFLKVKKDLTIPGFRKGHAPNIAIYDYLVRERQYLIGAITKAFAVTYQKQVKDAIPPQEDSKDKEANTDTPSEKDIVFAFTYQFPEDILKIFPRGAALVELEQKKSFKVSGITVMAKINQNFDPHTLLEHEKIKTIVENLIALIKTDASGLSKDTQTETDLHLQQFTEQFPFRALFLLNINQPNPSTQWPTCFYLENVETHQKLLVPVKLFEQSIKGQENRRMDEVLFRVPQNLEYDLNGFGNTLPAGEYRPIFHYQGNLIHKGSFFGEKKPHMTDLVRLYLQTNWTEIFQEAYDLEVVNTILSLIPSECRLGDPVNGSSIAWSDLMPEHTLFNVIIRSFQKVLARWIDNHKELTDKGLIFSYIMTMVWWQLSINPQLFQMENIQHDQMNPILINIGEEQLFKNDSWLRQNDIFTFQYPQIWLLLMDVLSSSLEDEDALILK